MSTPIFDEKLSFLNRFILELVGEYQAGKINSWEALDEKVKSFFTPERMNQIDSSLADLFDVTGVDFSEAQIELATQNIPNAKFICEDMTKLKFSENTFDGICSYYAIIHIPRAEHQLLLLNFYHMLKTGGIALLCLGAENLIDDIDENYLGTRMYWSHYDSETYLKMLKECGFALIWSKYVKDSTCAGAGHLFVLAQKK